MRERYGRWRRARLGVVAAVVLATAAVTWPAQRPAEAHLATWGSWEITRQNLDVLFPEATDYLRKKYVYTEKEIEAIEANLGFALYPEDKTPEFYIAVKEEGGAKKLLGVALFIDPRVKPKVVGGEVIRLEVGIGVDTKGQIARMAVYDYKGDPALAAAPFLDQFRGRALEHNFKVSASPGKGSVGKPWVKPVAGEPEESQLIANAAREALYLMKVALGK